MSFFLQIFIFIPLIGFLISLFIPEKAEGLLSKVAFLTAGLQLNLGLLFIGYWLLHGYPILNLPDWTLFQNKHYVFLIDFGFDMITAVYFIVGALLTFMITIYSRTYLHRENGYKRFFNTVMFFYLGYNLTIFAGNFETLFIGWEILGISSFLLIAFYRDRYLPVKNAAKVFSVYRIGDVGLLLAMWLSHHLFHENITFIKLHQAELVSEHLQSHTLMGSLIAFAILLSAAAKSAQLPFSSWLPRAMEGPTPSSAIFYGSLSVHIGVFLLLRTFPIWENQYTVRVVFGLLGLVTAAVAANIGRVQSTIKTQVAYASIAQIGIMFVEISLGLWQVALIHFAGNAFLRTYQLLVSPSVVSYKIREQFYNFQARPQTLEASYPQKIRNTFYLLALKEWNLDTLLYKIIWNPLKLAARKLRFINRKVLLFVLMPLYLASLFLVYHKEYVPAGLGTLLPTFYGFLGLVMVIKAFGENKDVLLAWGLILMNHLWITIAIGFNYSFDYNEIHLYLSGVLVAAAVGYWVIRKLRQREDAVGLDRYHGHSYEYPGLSLLFLFACLALTGFPISPTFVGEDLIFSHISENQWLLAAFISLSYVIDGLALIRMYSRLFLGPHVKTYHEVAYRSA